MKRIAITVFVFLIVIAGAYWVWNRFLLKSTAPLPKTASLMNLILSGDSQICTFNEQEVSGTFYIANKKVKGEFITTEEGESFKNYILSDDNYTYLWSEGNSTGLKLSYRAPGDFSEDFSLPTGVIDSNKIYNYSCDNWKVDEKIFDVPSDVLFQIPPEPSDSSTDSGIIFIPTQINSEQ